MIFPSAIVHDSGEPSPAGPGHRTAGTGSRRLPRHGCARGSAMVLVVVVMGIISILLMVNGRTLAQLGRQIRTVEDRQQKRWNSLPTVPATNTDLIPRPARVK